MLSFILITKVLMHTFEVKIEIAVAYGSPLVSTTLVVDYIVKLVQVWTMDGAQLITKLHFYWFILNENLFVYSCFCQYRTLGKICVKITCANWTTFKWSIIFLYFYTQEKINHQISGYENHKTKEFIIVAKIIRINHSIDGPTWY